MEQVVAVREEDLALLAAQAGLSILATTTPEVLDDDAAHLATWQERGYAADMGFMQRPTGLLSDARAIFPPTRSIVMVSVYYDRREREPLRRGHGRVARYAWGRDYHKVLRSRLKSFCALVERAVGRTIQARIFADSVPLLERALARRAGLGFIGKNTMVITPKQGSFFFIGEVLWDLDVVPKDRSESSSSAGCKTCTRCMTACPTEALVAEKVLDARRCISYLTIEKRGALVEHERRWLGEWVFGCDICQDVCPFNVVPLKGRYRASVTELDSEAGVGASLALEQVLGLRTHEAFTGVFAGTPLMRATRPGLLRNAAIVAANTHAVHLVESLRDAARHDESEIVRQHALWALAEMGSREGGALVSSVRCELADARSDTSEQVRAEVARLLGEPWSAELPLR